MYLMDWVSVFSLMHVVTLCGDLDTALYRLLGAVLEGHRESTSKQLACCRVSAMILLQKEWPLASDCLCAHAPG